MGMRSKPRIKYYLALACSGYTINMPMFSYRSSRFVLLDMPLRYDVLA